MRESQRKEVARQEMSSCRRRLCVVIGALIALVQAMNLFVLHGMHKSHSSKEQPQDAPFATREYVKAAADYFVDMNDFPTWISDYFQWHNEMRLKFPGNELFTNPDAPKLLVRTCLGLCGGLNDRLGQLPWDLYLANQTNRVLLISWSRPRALENFLVPNQVDWTIPGEVEGWGFDDMPKVRALPRLFADMPESNPDGDFGTVQVDDAIQRANVGKYKGEKILTQRILGHLLESNLESRLERLGETDMIHDTLTFGRIFKAMFKPSPEIQAILDQVYADLNLAPKQYTAVHCRVRHPKARPSGEATTIDKTGLPFHGADKDFAVETATQAIYCARTQSSDKNEPVYFFSDSNDLVKYMVEDLKNEDFLERNASMIDQNKVDATAVRAVRPVNLVAREMSNKNVHIDKQKGLLAPAYYATFVDLYLAMGARCMTYGIGFYAVFASKLSGIQCQVLYQEELWGGTSSKQEKAKICTPDTYKHLVEADSMETR